MDIILSKVDIGLFVIMVPILSRHLQCQNPCGKDFGMLKVSLKVKLFMWCFSKSILPAKDKLITCRVDVHSDCPVCGSHDESLLHLFFEYSLSLQLWDSMGKDWGPVLSSLEWLVEVLSSLNHESMYSIFMNLWGIWWNRNKVVWDHKFHSTSQICQSVNSYYSEWTWHNK